MTRWYVRHRMTIAGAAFVLPALAVIALFFLYPAIQSFRLSVTDWNGISPDYRFVGLDNFREVIEAPQFKRMLSNTLFLIVLYVPVLNAIALLLAVVIYDVGRLANFYKVVLYLPNILSMVVVGVIWKVIYNPVFGPLAYLFEKLGKPDWVQDWIGQTATVMPALSLSIVWYAVGFYLLIYLGGLSTVPKEIYESAEMDGVGWRRQLLSLTLPMIAQSVTINVVLSIIGILTIFDLPFILTGGGPGFASQTMAISVYIYAFKSMQQGHAMALAVILTVITMIVALALLTALRRKEVTDE
ncbi:carbohydrate ABC transporter permease [Cohnella fermenti]|uniref:Sugar ABC transporter permease n=1 Tax=Cohnella fermenti TaxID=2565925 RepID=A0A4S4BQC6_9BACL|nr:sugar ABC transporter permease [Cohnella fermenti]THF77130.1 sugar ABC transporter permease [Cohnella fermenti]